MEQKEYVILSLFNGMSCGFMALEKLGIKIKKYFASEIDKYANQAAKIINPETIFVGDVTKVSYKNGVLYTENGEFETEIDIILAGSPCQGFSYEGKRLNFNDPRSKLFFDFVRIKDEVKKENPELLFFLENVRMNKDAEKVITDILNIEPIFINSKLLSAQSRPRLYWCNFGRIYQQKFFGPPSNLIPLPKDKKILLKDILEEEIDEKYFLSKKMIDCFINHKARNKESGNGFGFKIKNLETDKAFCIDTKEGTPANNNYIKVKKVCIKEPVNYPFMLKEERTEEGKKMRSEHSKQTGKDTTPRNGNNKQYTQRNDEKANCLTCSSSMFNIVFEKEKIIQVKDDKHFQFNFKEEITNEGLQLKIKQGTKDGHAIIKPGDCFDAQQPTSNTRRGRKMITKANALPARKPEFFKFDGYRIRRLTPRECMRLQTIPEKHIDKLLTGGISDTQLYKMTGNGWTVDVIAYLLRFANL